MGALTEIEIFDCLRTNLRLAAEHCDDLARLPAKGPTYIKLRDELKLIEGCCRQASAWREDTRWLKWGLVAAEAHKKAGGWLRGVLHDDGHRRPLPPGKMHPMFVGLGAFLRHMGYVTEHLRTARTGVAGMILPAAAHVARPDTRVHISVPAHLQARPSGLLVPAGVTVQ